MRVISDLKKIQKIELDILEYIVSVCQKQKLRYFLAGGTLLGAIRHQGFIPWDNDVDISMPRPDYDKLIQYLRNNPDKRYKLFEIRNDNDYYYTFIKIVDTMTFVNELTKQSKIKGMGLFVDIFPIDGICEEREDALKRLSYVNKWSDKIAVSVISSKGRSFYRRCTHAFWYILFQILGREKCNECVNNTMRKTPFGTTNYVVSTYGLRKEKEIIDYECFASTVDVEFEGKKYPAPVGYDKYLTQMYGDYMKLPPVEERIEPHDVEVYLKEDDE